MTATQKDKDSNTMERAATKNESGNTGKDDGAPTVDELLRKHGNAMREAVEKLKGIEVIANTCAASDGMGQHIYNSRMFYVMDDVLFEACKELDSFLSAAGW